MEKTRTQNEQGLETLPHSHAGTLHSIVQTTQGHQPSHWRSTQGIQGGDLFAPAIHDLRGGVEIIV